MASCGADGIVRVHNVASGAIECQLKASFHHDTPLELKRVRFDAAGGRVVAAGENGIIHVWSLDGVGMPLELIGHGWGIYDICASPDGTFAFSAGGDGTLRKWDLLTGEQVYARHVSTWQAFSVDLTSDGSLVVVGTHDGHGSILDAASGEVLRSFEMPRGTAEPTPDGSRVGLMCVKVSPDGRTIAAGVGTSLAARDRERKTPIHIFDLPTGRLLDTRDGHHASVSGVAFTSDSRTLFSVGLDGRLLRWDLRSADPPVVVASRPCFAWDVLVNERAGEVIWALSTGQVLAHDLETGEERWSFQAHESAVSSLDLSSNGSRLLTSGLFLAGVTLWDATTRKRLVTLAEDMRGSWSAGFAGQDRIIVGEALDSGHYFGALTGELRCFEAVPAMGQLASRLSARQEQARCRDRWLELERTVQRAIEARDRDDLSEMDRLLSEVVTSLDASPLHEPVFETWLRRRVGDVYSSRNHHDEAIRQHEVVAEICESRGRAGTLMLKMTLRQICRCLIRKGQLAEAQEYCSRLLSLCREELGKPGGMRLMQDIGDAYLDAGDTSNAEPLMERALELRRERFGELHRDTLYSMRQLARLFNRAGRYAEAAGIRAELYAARCQAQGSDHPETLLVLANMAGDVLLAGERERGAHLARQIFDAVLAKEPDPGLHSALNNAAWVVVVHPDLTADLYPMAHEAAQRAVGLGNLEVSLNTLGTAQYRVGEYEQALRTLRRSDELLADAGSPYPGDWAFMAMSHHQLGETEKAATALSRLRELMQEPRHASDHECQRFLREAETLIESPRTDRIAIPP
jgi:WD40 repeat protein